MKNIIILLTMILSVSMAYAQEQVIEKDSIELVIDDKPKKTKEEKKEQRQKVWKWVKLGAKGLVAILIIGVLI